MAAMETDIQDNRKEAEPRLRTQKKGFLLYYDYRKHLALLNDEERGKLLMALLDYGEHGTQPELEGAALMAFPSFRHKWTETPRSTPKPSRNEAKRGKWAADLQKHKKQMLFLKSKANQKKEIQ